MYYPAQHDEYRTEYLSWPDEIFRLCTICQTMLIFAFADNGKVVKTLHGPIYQIVYYYTCPNPKCEHHKQYFNPSPRYDLNTSYFGKDVFERVSKELLVFKQNPEQIHFRLIEDYGLEIDLRTVQRMCRDILIVKSHQIDEKTKTIIDENKGIVIAADAQNPGQKTDALWLFTDLLSGRLLETRMTKSMSSDQLFEEIEAILAKYNTRLLGGVSDKQNILEKCFRDKYPNIPHQFCTFHFIDHLWKHLEFFDTQIFQKLNSFVQMLYINTKSDSHPIIFEELGERKVRDVFAPMNADFQKMTKIRNKKFHQLRGLILYRNLKRYQLKIEDALSSRSPRSRIEKMLFRLLPRLQTELDNLTGIFREDLFMFDMFQLIYKIIYAPISHRAEKQGTLDNIFGQIWAIAQSKNKSLCLENLRSFIPRQTSTCAEILGEWVRLWNSYLPGLFSYYDLPLSIQTNQAQEQAFGQEKMALIRRMAKKEVGQMLAFQGEMYLRLFHCAPEEITSNLVKEIMNSQLFLLREEYHEHTAEIMKDWYYKDQEFQGIDEVLQLCKV